MKLGQDIMTFNYYDDIIEKNGALTSKTPKNGSIFSYDFDLGREFQSVQLGNINIFQYNTQTQKDPDPDSNNMYKLKLSLLNDDFVFESSLTSYLNDTFLAYNCKPSSDKYL